MSAGLICLAVFVSSCAGPQHAKRDNLPVISFIYELQEPEICFNIKELEYVVNSFKSRGFPVLGTGIFPDERLSQLCGVIIKPRIINFECVQGDGDGEELYFRSEVGFDIYTEDQKTAEIRSKAQYMQYEVFTKFPYYISKTPYINHVFHRLVKEQLDALCDQAEEIIRTL